MQVVGPEWFGLPHWRDGHCRRTLPQSGTEGGDAITALNAFIHEANALANSRRLTAAGAAPLISAAEGIIATL